MSRRAERRRQGKRCAQDFCGLGRGWPARTGLGGLRFGNGIPGTRHTLLFTAGIADEMHGLRGEITARH
jgi:hypothetical protein